MNNINEIMSTFQSKLDSRLNSKKNILRTLHKEDIYVVDDASMSNDTKEIISHFAKEQQPTFLAFTGIIVLTIDSEELASKVHAEIQKLIKAKNYSIKEESWANSDNTPSTYCFRFKY